MLLPETARRAWDGAGAGRPRLARPASARGRGLACNLHLLRAHRLAPRLGERVGRASDGRQPSSSGRGVPDIGGGQAASLVQITAEVLGVPQESIAVHIGDSRAHAARRHHHRDPPALHVGLRGAQGGQRAPGDRWWPRPPSCSPSPPDALELAERGGGGPGPARSAGGLPASWPRRARRAHRSRSSFAVYQAPAGQVDGLRDRAGQGVPRLHLRLPGGRGGGGRGDRRGPGGQADAACYDVGRAINRNSVEGQIEGGAAHGARLRAPGGGPGPARA